MAASKREHRFLAKLLFAGYLAVLFYFLFFSEGMGRTENAALRCNLVPFREIMRFVRHASYFPPEVLIINLFGNVAAFMPYGYILPHIKKRRIGVFQTTVHAFFFSLSIECVQLLLRVGSFDVDDILLNTLGGFLGCVLYYFIHRKKRRKR